MAVSFQIGGLAGAFAVVAAGCAPAPAIDVIETSRTTADPPNRCENEE